MFGAERRKARVLPWTGVARVGRRRIFTAAIGKEPSFERCWPRGHRGKGFADLAKQRLEPLRRNAEDVLDRVIAPAVQRVDQPEARLEPVRIFLRELIRQPVLLTKGSDVLGLSHKFASKRL